MLLAFSEICLWKLMLKMSGFFHYSFPNTNYGVECPVSAGVRSEAWIPVIQKDRLYLEFETNLKNQICGNRFLILSTSLTRCHSFGMATFNKHGCAQMGSQWCLFGDCSQKRCDAHSTHLKFCKWSFIFPFKLVFSKSSSLLPPFLLLMVDGSCLETSALRASPVNERVFLWHLSWHWQTEIFSCHSYEVSSDGLGATVRSHKWFHSYFYFVTLQLKKKMFAFISAVSPTLSRVRVFMCKEQSKRMHCVKLSAVNKVNLFIRTP